MKIVCAWCEKEMGEKPGEGITHSMCSSCKQKQKEEIERRKKEKEEKDKQGKK